VAGTAVRPSLTVSATDDRALSTLSALTERRYRFLCSPHEVGWINRSVDVAPFEEYSHAS